VLGLAEVAEHATRTTARGGTEHAGNEEPNESNDEDERKERDDQALPNAGRDLLELAAGQCVDLFKPVVLASGSKSLDNDGCWLVLLPGKSLCHAMNGGIADLDGHLRIRGVLVGELLPRDDLTLAGHGLGQDQRHQHDEEHDRSAEHAAAAAGSACLAAFTAGTAAAGRARAIAFISCAACGAGLLFVRGRESEQIGHCGFSVRHRAIGHQSLFLASVQHSAPFPTPLRSTTCTFVG